MLNCKYFKTNFFYFVFLRFDLIRKLGQGTYGKVQLGIDKETGQEVCFICFSPAWNDFTDKLCKLTDLVDILD